MKLKNYILASLAIAGAMSMTSCNDDDTYDVVGNPDNLIYVTTTATTPLGLPNNSFAYQIYHTPVGSMLASSPSEIKFRVQSTRPAPQDITVRIAADPTAKVDGYASVPADANVNVSFDSDVLLIPQGANISNEVTATVDVSHVNWANLTESAYLLPISMVEVSGGVASQQQGHAYIGFASAVKEGMVNPDGNTALGTQISDKTGWSGIYKVTATGVEEVCPAALFDGNTSRAAIRVANHAPNTRDEVVTTIDLGKVYTLSSVRFDYYGSYWGINAGTLETSIDGESWSIQGSRTWSANPRQAIFAFWAPFQMRYVRLTSTSFYDGTGEGQYMTEFQAFE